jgi:hypothetical protein
VTCLLGSLPTVAAWAVGGNGDGNGDGNDNDGPVDVMIRPEQIRMTRHEDPGRHGLEAVVTARRYFGPDTVVTLAVARRHQPPHGRSEPAGEPERPTMLKARALGSAVPNAGDHVWLTVIDPVIVYPAATEP